MALKANSRLVYDFILEHFDDDFTAMDIAEATGLGIRTVNGVITSAFQRKKLVERVPAELELEDDDGNVMHKSVKLIRPTELFKAFDPDAEPEKEAKE